MNADALINVLRGNANPDNVAGMARYGINTRNTFGVSIPFLRQLARGYRRQHELALALWASDVHEARLLATLVDDPKQVTPAQMESWVKDLDSWDICDQLCNNLFTHTPYARAKSLAWSRRKPEFVRRAGFVLMAVQAVHRKDLPDAAFESYFPLMLQYATDERNFVRKAVNWALRQIGKRNPALRERAVATARQMLDINSSSARWIARDALRELEKPPR